MEYILTDKEMAQADRATSEKIGIPSLVLMERAALSVADEITQREPSAAKICILCGPGNNGADGLAAGRILLDRGFDVCFLMLSEKAPAKDSSLQVQLSILAAYGITPALFSEQRVADFSPDVIVDALFGTGLGRALEGRAAQACALMDKYRKQCGTVIVGLDLPSGVSALDGTILGCAPHCDYTVTFAFRKRGQLLFPGSQYCGEVILREIGITERALHGEPSMRVPDAADIASLLPARAESGNKGTFGKIAVLAGSYNMCGAALLCAEGALRSGAGMVRAVTCRENRQIIQSGLPEALLTTFSGTENDIEAKVGQALGWADIAAVGPGIGRSEDARKSVRAVFENSDSIKGLVIDADALRLLAEHEELQDFLVNRREDLPCILTPHPGELAALADVSLQEVLGDREYYTRALAEKYRCTVIGKDARTMVITAGDPAVYLITGGNSGMGTAGSGDVLTGAAAALLFAAVSEGRKDPAADAALAAAWIHAAAGDWAAAARGEYGMIASDICGALGNVLEDTARRSFK